MNNMIHAQAQAHVINVRHVLSPRRLMYQLWRRLPPFGRRLAVSVAAPKITMGVCAVIRDAQGRVLLAHHTYRRQAWGLPGGFIKQHEDPSAALERELAEELGVSAEVGPILAADMAGRHLTLYYQVTIAAAPRPDGVEIDTFRYTTRDEIPRLFGAESQAWLTPCWDRAA
jgi:ADP-ribose pyrophosphatase YjhB (NUDIX family)